MLTLYRRHNPTCSKASDRYWKRCTCPMWVEGVVEGGEYLRKSLKTKSWERAQILSKALEVSPEKSSEAKAGPVTIEHAVTEYLADGKARELAEATVYKLDITFRKQFLPWCRAEGYKLLRELDLGAMRAFRTTWKDGPMAKKKKQERFTGFFWFCIRAGWITENPTANLGRISANQAPTDYFPKDEFKKIVDATYVYQDRAQVGVDNSTRLRTLVLLMRWSGLAIRDAVTLERTRLVGDSVMLYRAKTGTPVFVPLPPHVADELRNVPEGPAPNPRYFFWSGNGLPKSAVANWQRSFRRLFVLAKLEKQDGSAKRCFPHMFRDTFAVEMLLAGVPIDQVSILLGHKSVRITEKHYSPWVKARQDQLAASVKNAWSEFDVESAPSKRKKKRKMESVTNATGLALVEAGA